jgi:methylmalonyl-CoA mutase C-terminal domain/subunit
LGDARPQLLAVCGKARSLDRTRAPFRTFLRFAAQARDLQSRLASPPARGELPARGAIAMSTSHKPRLLIGKPGLDGHDRGAKYVAQILRDAGFEVIYTGIRRSPEQIVDAAVQEDVAGIGLSLLSGAHLTLFRRVMELLRDRGAEDIIVFGGGTIPPADVEKLKEMGVAAVFTPGAPASEIVATVDALLATGHAR